ncbi:MAG: hypothetical protein ACRDMZ_08320, partial [Solirubrobacteraceae bacterium]
ISDEDATGTVQRVQVKLAPLTQHNSLASFGATDAVNGGTVNPVEHALAGDAAALHDQLYNAAVYPAGNADCESGQRGYPQRLATGYPAGLNIALDSRTPGNQGPTFKGRARVPAGESFSAEPTGIAPQVLP